MLFHVTITHDPQQCPGRRAAVPPELAAGTAVQLDSDETGRTITAHSVLWGASCILWGEPEHVAYAVMEGPDVDSVMRFIQTVVPIEWNVRALAVFSLPEQQALMRQVLATPAQLFGQPEIPRPDVEVTASETDTVPNAVVPEPSATATTQPPSAGVPQVVTRVVAGAGETESATTRFIERPAVPAVPDSPPTGGTAPASPTPKPTASITELLEQLDASGPQTVEREGLTETSEVPPANEPGTVILIREAEGAPVVRLQATSGPSLGSTYEVAAPGGTVGRLPENLIHLADGRVSRHHARIEFHDRDFWITDLASQNGTLVNGQMLGGEHRLREGDVIEIGTTRFSVSLGPDAPTQ